MKLSYRITWQTSLALLVLVATWSSLFYFLIIDEINDETDDFLEDYSENIITSSLAGESLPAQNSGTNNSYYIHEVTPDYVAQTPTLRYSDEMIYIKNKRETEPARILKTIFRDSLNNYYELAVSVPTIEKADLQRTILQWIVFLYVALLIAIVCINFWILKHSFKPLYNFLHWLEEFRVEKTRTEPDIRTNIPEFQKLNEAAIRSIRRSVKMYEQQKLFIGHASHEIQTPLAVCLNRLEMLSEDTFLSENQLSEIIKTKQSIQHLIKLNKLLLLLTKIENNQFPDKTEIVLNELIKKMIADYSEMYANKKIKVTVTESAVRTIDMNETLARVLFGNLIKNAFLHNRDKGKIGIQVMPQYISISNTGEESEPLDTSSMFNHFYHRSKKRGSSGLGLTLCQSICKRYQINIRYDYLNEMHVFTLFF